jgi:hypothetical protein
MKMKEWVEGVLQSASSSRSTLMPLATKTEVT